MTLLAAAGASHGDTTLLIGIVATALTALWGIVRKRLLHVPPPDYAPVGRWIGHMFG